MIGGGGMTREHIRAFQNVPGVTIAGIWNRTREKAETLARDLLEDPHMAARGVFHELDDDELGKVTVQGPFVKMSQTPGRVSFAGRPLGADTDRILADELDFSAERISALRRAGIV